MIIILLYQLRNIYCVPSSQPFDEVIQMRGHSICFQGKITTNILKFSLVLSEALGKVMCFQIPEDYTSVNLH